MSSPNTKWSTAAVLVCYLLSVPTRSEDHDLSSKLLIDPLLIAQAAEVWSVIATQENQLWPGWDASKTPLLLYLPGEQDVLINHPDPPEGFVPYTGPVEFPGGRIMVKNGPTLIEYDGQNTSRKINGVETLVVADTLSNRMNNIRALIQDPSPTDEKVRELEYEALGSDVYDSMGMIAHEAFHVYQYRKAPNKGASEVALRTYPVLAVDNNVGFALEGDALAEVLRATTPQEARAAAVRWLAVRRDRRSHLDAEAIAYEDGTEFNEGLAKYVEYRMTGALEGRTPGPGMKWAQGFHGYQDLSGVRERLIDQMVKHMRGEINVNNDPYGSSPLRMRLYYSGMAVAVLLERLSPGWHEGILRPRATLTELAEQAIGASPEELAAALSAARSAPSYRSLVRTKEELEAEGKKRIETLLAEICERTEGSVTIDYTELKVSKVGIAYTPFGVVGVDADQTIYRMVPVRARVQPGYGFKQTEAAPVLHDRKQKTFRMPLRDRVARHDLEKLLGVESLSESSIRNVELELPGVKVSARRAIVTWDKGHVTVSFSYR
jgi:hypothetical protein